MNFQPQLEQQLIAKSVVEQFGTRDCAPLAAAYLIECMRTEDITQLDARVTVDERAYRLRVHITVEPA